jgi:hypothetical protein
MLDILAGSELLTIMVVIALGALLGIIPFGPVRIGPAGALFVGLAFGALDPRPGFGLDVLQQPAPSPPRNAERGGGAGLLDRLDRRGR